MVNHRTAVVSQIRGSNCLRLTLASVAFFRASGDAPEKTGMRGWGPGFEPKSPRFYRLILPANAENQVKPPGESSCLASNYFERNS
jgi:hypothetical protein